jgi:hypothetical protein
LASGNLPAEHADILELVAEVDDAHGKHVGADHLQVEVGAADRSACLLVDDFGVEGREVERTIVLVDKVVARVAAELKVAGRIGEHGLQFGAEHAGTPETENVEAKACRVTLARCRS